MVVVVVVVVPASPRPWFCALSLLATHTSPDRDSSLQLAAPGGAHGAARAGAPGVRSERILLAPPWLISADNALGHRYKHWLYGKVPAPCVLLHFVCVASGEQSRILPMKLFGRWHREAVEVEVAAAERARNATMAAVAAAGGSSGSRRSLQRDASTRRRRSGKQRSGGGRADGDGGGGDREAAAAEPLAEAASRGGGSRPPRRLLALADSSIEAPMAPRPWPELNALYVLLGGLATLSGRALTLPALNCTGEPPTACTCRGQERGRAEGMSEVVPRSR